MYGVCYNCGGAHFAANCPNGPSARQLEDWWPEDPQAEQQLKKLCALQAVEAGCEAGCGCSRASCNRFAAFCDSDDEDDFDGMPEPAGYLNVFRKHKLERFTINDSSDSDLFGNAIDDAITEAGEDLGKSFNSIENSSNNELYNFCVPLLQPAHTHCNSKNFNIIHQRNP